ncbi:RNA polymerase sigma-70 factor, ECF subfamily [Streptomyces sp. 3213]|uniref:sigma-70 family RNA polymerase sigma factor n=1 Tax=Streptomyces sp. 3213.3 TaxID=1855348 RepID=UPI000895FE5D|nr:sigma-70 family RNA polymerase sigma factor [Streptomyces sp. 3213.3]SEC15163.1 RNA polymerase sigma-70 factor, ECF subfamily [Streptomyces sp. 3213] [Streptomyces sp. 3213.3]
MTGSEDDDSHDTLPTSVKELNALHGIPYEMPSTLEDFYRTYLQAQVRYAWTILGDKDAAKTVVRHLYRHLAMNWAAAQLEECGVEAYAWRNLKQLVDDQARAPFSGDPLGAAMAASDRSHAAHEAAWEMLRAMRSRMADLDSPAGLYTAMGNLPERQFDVIVLHYAHGYCSQQVAHIMGIHPSTVRAHRRLARERIAAELGIDLGDDEEKE